MSEEFLRVAKKEVIDDISEIGNLLKTCSSDDDVQKAATDIEKHVHKIKGLAPMMGQEEIGDIATLLDSLLKMLIAGRKIEGVYKTMKTSHEMMHNKINDLPVDMALLKSKILENHGSVLQ